MSALLDASVGRNLHHVQERIAVVKIRVQYLPYLRSITAKYLHLHSKESCTKLRNPNRYPAIPTIGVPLVVGSAGRLRHLLLLPLLLPRHALQGIRQTESVSHLLPKLFHHRYKFIGADQMR